MKIHFCTRYNVYHFDCVKPVYRHIVLLFSLRSLENNWFICSISGPGPVSIKTYI